jgi:alpha/beta superfamily hydrolase
MPGHGATTTRLASLAIEGPAGALEGLLQEREGVEPPVVAVVCHPHPLYGGTMNNKVVHRVAATLHALGASVLRFNFRGAGKSAGTHDRGAGELEDAAAAVRWMRERHPHAHPWVGGFSFGSWVAARLAAREASIERLILVAPPVRTSSFTSLRDCRTPKLVIQGTADEVCPPDLLREEYPRWAEPKRLEWVEGAGHFFDRQLGPLGDRLTLAIRQERWL